MSHSERNECPALSWMPEGDGLHDQTLCENWLFRLRRERFRSRSSDKTHDFFVTHLANGVHVIAITPEQEIILVRQFRAGSRRDSLETPGGLLNLGEDASVAGARELLEETGYAGDPPRQLGSLWPNPALLSMEISTIVIQNARLVTTPHLDQSEELVVERAPIKDIPSMIRDGRIDHAVCVAVLLWWLTLEKLG